VRALLHATVWERAAPRDVGDDLFAAALELARRNRVEATFARAYESRFAAEVASLDAHSRAFRRNLRDSSAVLRSAGVVPILIKADPALDYVYSNFDLVVGEDGWDAAVTTLRSWSLREWGHPLERDKILFAPRSGPAVHLHRSVGWFEIPIISAEKGLRDRAHADQDAGCLVPASYDRLRIVLAHAAFQNLAVDLADLWEIRNLVDDDTTAAASREASTEGWSRTFHAFLAWSIRLIGRLDAGEPLALPAPAPVGPALGAGFEHAAASRNALGTAAREVLLRPVLVAAKLRRFVRAEHAGRGAAVSPGEREHAVPHQPPSDRISSR
jgi:hypothetical protein